MQRQRGELVPIGEVVGVLDGPVKAIREAGPQARHRLIQVDQIAAALERPQTGFISMRKLVESSVEWPSCTGPHRLRWNRRDCHVRSSGPVDAGSRLRSWWFHTLGSHRFSAVASPRTCS